MAAFEGIELCQAFGRTLKAEDGRGAGGTVVALAADGRLVWSHASGRRGPDDARAPDLDTPFRLASITKLMTAAVFLQACRRGAMALDDPVVQYVPEAVRIQGLEATDQLSLRRLASHTGGLDTEASAFDQAHAPNVDWQETTIRALAHTTRSQTPGTYRYSNIGFALLGLALVRAVGAPLERLYRHRLFEPLGMGSSGTVLNGDRPPGLVEGAHLQEGLADWETPRRQHAGRGYRVPSGGACGSARDLLVLARALMDGEWAATRAEMAAPQVELENSRRWDAYGLGLQLCLGRGQPLMGHGGDFTGYCTELVIMPDAGLALVLLRNYSEPEGDTRYRAHALLHRLAGMQAAGDDHRR